MKTKMILHNAVAVLFGFALITVLLISSFEAAMYADFDVYRHEYEKYNVLSDLDMTMDDAMFVTKEMMAYLRGKGDTLSVVTTVEGKEQDFFNEQDRFHMGEVRELFIGGLNIRMLSCAVMVVCLLILVLTKADLKKILPKGYQTALAVTFGLSFLLGIACAVDFSRVFVLFHQIFFDNDMWLFDPAEDYMIRMLPEGLFFDMVIRIGVIFGILLIAVLLISFIPQILNYKKKLA